MPVVNQVNYERSASCGVRVQVEAVNDALGPWASRHRCLNVAETRRDPASFWTERAYSRLRRTKARVDRGDVIRSSHPIQPAR